MLIAILGRGIQFELGWEPTRDLEMCAPDGSHLVDRQPIDDHSPNCRIGGGELNLLAGVELHRRQSANLMVCAYGNRSPYLVDIDAPSESEIMSVKLAYMIQELTLESPGIDVWPKEKVVEGRSNTRRELQNIFELAVKMGIKDVAVITVCVHLPRTFAFAEDHLLLNGEFDDIKVKYHASEQILVEADPAKYAPRMLAMYKSQAFGRTAYFEHRGTLAYLAGNY